MQLSLRQLEALWVQAGGDPDEARMMAHIAKRESGGRPGAQNLKHPDHSIGLWQINQLAWRDALGLTDTQLKDPLTNARAAVAVRKKQGLKAWATYNPEIDAKYLKRALGGGQLNHDGSLFGAIADKATEGGFQQEPAPLRVFDDVADALGAIFSTLTDPQTWLRVLMFFGGLVLGVLAFRQLATAARGA